MFYKPDTTYEHLILKQDRFKKKFDLFLIFAMKLLRSAFTISFPVAVMLMISVHTEAQEKDDVIVISTDVISPDDSLLIDRLIYTAQQFLITGQLDSAAFYTDRAINISRNLNYRQGKTTAYLLKAEVETRKQAFPLALRNYFSAVRELEWLGDSIGIANINTEIGKLYLNAGLYRKAIEYLRRSESIYNNSGMQADLVAVKYSIASANLDLGQYDQALEEYLDLLKYYEEKDEISRVLRTLSNIILCYHKLHEYDLSMEYNRKALSIYENTSDNPGRLIALNNIGYNYKYLEDHDKSIQYFKEALDLMEKMPATDEFTKVITLINIAVVYQNTGDFENAVEYLQQAIKLLEKKNDKPELANTCDLLSNVYFLSGDYHNSLIYNENAIRLARETGDKMRLSNAYLTLSKIRTALYEYEEALQFGLGAEIKLNLISFSGVGKIFGLDHHAVRALNHVATPPKAAMFTHVLAPGNDPGPVIFNAFDNALSCGHELSPSYIPAACSSLTGSPFLAGVILGTKANIRSRASRASAFIT